MALRTIVQDGDPILKKVCRPVTKFDDRLGTLLAVSYTHLDVYKRQASARARATIRPVVSVRLPVWLAFTPRLPLSRSPFWPVKMCIRDSYKRRNLSWLNILFKV